jgi:hypothetical protein
LELFKERKVECLFKLDEFSSTSETRTAYYKNPV